jgi:intracellular septation protein A
MGPSRTDAIISAKRSHGTALHQALADRVRCLKYMDQILPTSTSWGHVRSMVRHALPGFLLPAVVYFLLKPHLGVLIALAVAACLPVVDAVVRKVRRRAQNVMALVFLPMTAVGIALAAMLHSPVFILAKGGVTSAMMGIAFAISAFIGRPLTRTMALHLSSDQKESRTRLAERWAGPEAHAVFCILSIGWGLLMLAIGGQQIILALSASPGLVMLLEPPVHAVATILGIAGSVLYVKRIQRRHPGLALLPARRAVAVAA